MKWLKTPACLAGFLVLLFSAFAFSGIAGIPFHPDESTQLL